MLKNAFLFHGENTYTLQHTLQERKLGFAQKFGAESIFEFSSQNRDLGQIKQALYAGGLFVQKKLIILYGIPKDTNDANALAADKIEKFFEDLQQNIALIPEDSLLVLVAYKPDKRTKPFKRCLENLQNKEFPLYKEAQLKTFLKEQLAPLPVSEEILSYILLKIGTDMRRLASEAQKLKI